MLKKSKPKKKNYYFISVKKRGTKITPLRYPELSQKYPEIKHLIRFAEKSLPERMTYKGKLRYMYEVMCENKSLGFLDFVAMVMPQYNEHNERQRLRRSATGERFKIEYYDDVLVAYSLYLRLRRIVKDVIISVYKNNPELKVIAKITKSGKRGIHGLS